MTILENICNMIRKTGMLDGYDRVIAGVSGGADSVFLFFVLKELLAGETPFSVIHIHHGIRGSEADRDAEFVSDLCRRWDVPCEMIRRDVPALAREEGLTLEEAGRKVRYEIFNERCASGKCAVALAHHRDDQAETFLFRLARGSGLHGLAGMRRKRDCYVRPLLDVSRAEIEEYLTERGIPWCEDSTNADDEAARNRIRHRVLPLLTEEVNSRAAEHIAAAAGQLADVSDFVRDEGLRRSVSYLTDLSGSFPTEVIHISDALLGEPAAMQSEILRIAVMRALGGNWPKDYGAVHIKDMIALFGRETGKRILLPSGLTAVRCADGIRIGDSRKGDFSEEPDAEKYGFLREMEGNGCIFLEEMDAAPDPIPEKRYTKWLDCDKINVKLLFRNRKPGDYLTVDARGSRKKLSDYFTDQKVPGELRDRIPLLSDGSEIVWVVGMRIGYRYRVTESTSRVLRAEWKPNGHMEVDSYGKDQCDDSGGEDQ